MLTIVTVLHICLVGLTFYTICVTIGVCYKCITGGSDYDETRSQKFIAEHCTRIVRDNRTGNYSISDAS